MDRRRPPQPPPVPRRRRRARRHRPRSAAGRIGAAAPTRQPRRLRPTVAGSGPADARARHAVRRQRRAQHRRPDRRHGVRRTAGSAGPRSGRRCTTSATGSGSIRRCAAARRCGTTDGSPSSTGRLRAPRSQPLPLHGRVAGRLGATTCRPAGSGAGSTSVADDPLDAVASGRLPLLLRRRAPIGGRRAGGRSCSPATTHSPAPSRCRPVYGGRRRGSPGCSSPARPPTCSPSSDTVGPLLGESGDGRGRRARRRGLGCEPRCGRHADRGRPPDPRLHRRPGAASTPTPAGADVHAALLGQLDAAVGVRSSTAWPTGR